MKAFESEAGDYLGAKVATVSSGTLALLLVLEALGPVKGRKVIIPSFTFVATAQAVLYAGATPLFCDVQDDLTLDPKDLEELLLDSKDDVASVIPVHTYGMPCRIDEIERVVDSASTRAGRHIPVIYDAAHAFGSSIDNRKIGSFGDAEVFSLSATKALVSIEGGMISTRNEDLIERIHKMRNYGIGENYEAYFPGMNGKMSELHAIVGSFNLARLDDLVESRQQVAAHYTAALAEATTFHTIPVPEQVRHTFKDFTVLTPPHLTDSRDDVMKLLLEEGIENRRYFWPPVHHHRLFARYATRELPATDQLGKRVITLPFFPSMRNDEVDRVVDALALAEKRLS